MNRLLFYRSLGLLSPQNFARIHTYHLINSILLEPNLRFNGGAKELLDGNEDIGSAKTSSEPNYWAHQAGVNALAIESDGSILISGGADSNIKLWDLDMIPTKPEHILEPAGTVSRDVSSHRFGITQLSFYPFDSGAFLSSSYDHHLKVYDTQRLALAADFDLASIVYTHALSPIASHVIVACATQHPAVRLVDLRSGACTHSLAGHHGALLSLNWSPKLDHNLASGGVDGTIRLWDIRKGNAAIRVFDMEDSTGITSSNEMGQYTRSQFSGKSHLAAVNAITWTDDGSYIISSGHDNRIRVWDAATGANTLVNFGPTLKNSHLSNLPMLSSPTALVPLKKSVLLYPNEKELLFFELHEGRILKRLKVPGPYMSTVRSRTGKRNVTSRITSLVWKGQAEGFYTGHTDGQIGAWLPRSDNEELENDIEVSREGGDKSEGGKRKRQLLDDVFQNLTRQKISFG